MQFVRMINVGTKPYDFHQANKKRILQVGEEAMVPWDLATSLFGDPFTTDTPKEPARTRAWQQASGIHNFTTVESEAKSRGIPTEEYWDSIKPNIQVFDVETNERIYMVIEDQDGTKTNGVQPQLNEVLNQVALQQQIADLQRTVASLVQLQLAAVQTTTATGQGEMVTQDGPGQSATADAGPGSAFDLPTPAEAGADAPPVSTSVPSEDIPQTVPSGSTGKLAQKVKA